MDWFSLGGVLIFGSACFAFGAFWAGRDDGLDDYERGFNDGIAIGRRPSEGPGRFTNAAPAQHATEAEVEIRAATGAARVGGGLGRDGQTVGWPQSAGSDGHVMPAHRDAG